MDHPDIFQQVNLLLKQQLGYALHPDHADHFRAQINRAGLRRTTEAIRLTVLERPESPSEAHTVLEGIIWQLTPKRGLTDRLRKPQAHV
jgi:hypothetical protein